MGTIKTIWYGQLKNPVADQIGGHNNLLELRYLPNLQPFDEIHRQ